MIGILHETVLGTAQRSIAHPALAAFILVSALVPDGHARDIGALGGGGGSEFRQTCRPNDLVIGFDIQSGTALDSIAAVRAGLNPERTEIATNWYSEFPRGGLAEYRSRRGWLARVGAGDCGVGAVLHGAG